MNQTKNQSGSAFVIIVIIVTAVIIGLVGFVFWRNFINISTPTNHVTTYAECVASKDSKLLETYPEQCVTADGKSFSNPNQTAKTNEVDFANVTTNELDGRIMTLHYPDGWKVVVKEDGDKTSGVDAYVRNTKLTSPSGNVVIDFNIMKGGGYGGYCEPTDVTVTHIETKPVPATLNLRYAEVISHNTFGTEDYYTYQSEIQKLTPAISAVKVGSSGCDLVYAGLFANDTAVAPLAKVSITVGNITVDAHPTEQTIKNALKGDEYTTAQSILLTLTDK